MSRSLSFPLEKNIRESVSGVLLARPWSPVSNSPLQNVQFLSIWSRSNSPPSCKTSLFVPPSPFQRLRLPPTGPESTLHAESLSSSSYDESSSSSSSSPSASCHDFSPGSGTPAKSESGWPGLLRLGGVMLDWRPPAAENLVQLRL